MTLREPGPESAPRSLGPYELDRKIGSGGMGTVYLAHRNDQEYRRDVAVKLLNEGIRDESRIRRFKTERQILAQLSHPYIARLYEGGTTDEARPYFVMEHIEGVPINTYCDENRLSIVARIELFRKVCSAVQYAHQSLVVHRDIKPSNILVTPSGEPKLLDFGIAKLLDTEGSPDTTLITKLGQRPMTPYYASPEQIYGEPITTATDVYSLGVLFYKLLTGRLPHRNTKGIPQEPLDVMGDKEPSKPSTTLDEEETVEEICWQRSAAPHQLRRQLSGDLDNIVLMALRFEPARRYSSVEQFSEDLQRHLLGLPVLARRPTFRYRSGRFLARHRWGSTFALLFLTLVIAFGVVMSWQATQIAHERDRAELARLRAEEERERVEAARRSAELERDKAREIKDFMAGLFLESHPRESAGRELTAREILERGAERVNEDLKDQPELQASLMETIGQVYADLDQFDQAQALLERSLELRRQVFGDEHEDVANSLNEIATLRYRQGFYAKAVSLYRQSLAIREKTLGSDHPAVGESLNNLAAAYLGVKDFTQAAPLMKRSLEISEKALGPHHPDVLLTMANLGATYYQHGRLSQAEPYLRRAIELQEASLGPDHPDLAWSLIQLGNGYRDQGDFEAAEPLMLRSLAIFEKAYHENHTSVSYVLRSLGVLFSTSGDHEQAETFLQRALKIQQGLDNLWHIAVTLYAQAHLAYEKGEDDLAEALVLEALAKNNELNASLHAITLDQYLLVRIYMRQEKLEEAGRLLEITLRSSEQLVAEKKDDLLARMLLASVLYLQGRLEQKLGRTVEAEAFWQRAIATIDAYKRSLESVQDLEIQAMVLSALGRTEEARPIVDHLLAKGWHSRDFRELMEAF